MLKIRKKISKIYLLGLFALLALFILGQYRVQTHITIEYAPDPTGDAYASVWRGGEAQDTYEVREHRAELYLWGTDFEQLRPIHYKSWEDIVIRKISFRIQGRTALELQPEAIEKYFSYNEDISEIDIGAAKLKMNICGENPALIPSEALLAELSGAAVYAGFWKFVFLIICYTLVYGCFFKRADLRRSHGYEQILDVILGIVAVSALLLSWSIAFSSAYGGTVHPDEVQTRAAVDYYRTHWAQPDVRSGFVAQTVSGYGMTRLSEINLYYLFAGKLAELVDIKYSFRAFGMLMIFALACFVMKKMKRERYLAVLFFATPQLWYLFSYATSDAWDYLVASLAVYETIGENSALARIFQERFSRKRIPAYLGVGFLFANLLMAKKTFYLVLLLIFLLLLYRLIFSGKERRKKLFGNYMALLGIALAIVFVRYLPDFHYYGVHKAEAVAEVIETTALPEYKPSTPAAQQAKSTLLYEKGVSLKEFFTEWDFNGTLFENYFGCYGIYSLKANGWYYILMGALYAALYGAVGVGVRRRCKRERAAGNRSAARQMSLIYWTMWGLTALMYLMTVYNAYFVDFQPQGRYLFPAIPALACQMALDRETANSRTVRTLVAALAVVSLYSFYKIAYRNF